MCVDYRHQLALCQGLNRDYAQLREWQVEKYDDSFSHSEYKKVILLLSPGFDKVKLYG